ncbi:MAG: hypothetical protein Q8R55_03210 [Candidatus Taylorbacteria bacterium]|nr:hypothetical protein [Candidatus Taylorbacteria bacterium]
MINQQLLDYVRQQLANGVGKEEIEKALATQGWNEQDINEAFVTTGKVSSVPTDPLSTPSPITVAGNPLSASIENKTWSKSIPRINIGFLVISLLLVFGLDLTILVSSPDLAGFYIVMLVVLIIFGMFFYRENRILNKRFAHSHSTLDAWITTLIVIRNIVFVLNFIPLIQLAGAVALVYGGIPYLMIYSILLYKRQKII